MYNKVELCGVNTAQLPVLSESEKRQLLLQAHAGDAGARERMVEGNLRLVLSVVQRFAQRGENLDDLFQVGCIGLIKAIDNFDPAQPVRFSTYGVPMIIGEIRRFLRDNNALRVSRSLRDTAYRAMQARETLEKQLGREPTMDEIAGEAGLSRREVTAALESVVEPVSLEEPVYTDGGDAMYLIDQVRDPDGEDSWISGLQFRQTVAGLTRTSRTETSLCTVDLLHPNAAAAARTVAPRSTMYSASCTARCSGSALIPPRPLYRAATAYAPGRAIMSARVDFYRPVALY